MDIIFKFGVLFHNNGYVYEKINTHSGEKNIFEMFPRQNILITVVASPPPPKKKKKKEKKNTFDVIVNE